MRIWILALMVLLAGCTSNDAEPLAGDDTAEPTSDADSGEPSNEPETGPEPHIQEASVDWLVPASIGCALNAAEPAGDGVVYGSVAIDPETQGKPFQATFHGTDGLGVQIVFYAAGGEAVGSQAALYALGDDEVVKGEVPFGAVQARLAACAAGALSADYRAGDLEPA